LHIPDGFISPKVYVPAYAGAFALWAWGLRRMRVRLREETIPLLAVLTALVFVLMTIALPFPGGTTIHATGVALLAVLFGVWTSFLATTLVLLMQALLLGAGGITALPINALAIGLLGATAAVAGYRCLRGWNETAALVAAGWLSVVLPAGVVALTLGIQPLIAHAPDGTPRFFPFGLEVTLPAVVLPHLVVGVGEGLLTLFVYRLVGRWVRG